MQIPLAQNIWRSKEKRREERAPNDIERERERERESSNLCAGNDEERLRKSLEKCKIEEVFKILSRIHQIEVLRSRATVRLICLWSYLSLERKSLRSSDQSACPLDRRKPRSSETPFSVWHPRMLISLPIAQ
ncbi:unnamed protein product [Camellia sinensis]